MLFRHVVIGGGAGFIGSALHYAFKVEGWQATIVSRERVDGRKSLTWGDIERVGLPDTVTDVINVAGANVLDPMKRWTPQFKDTVRKSRINTTKKLANAIKDNPQIQTFTTISGVGYYPPSDTREYTEYDKCEKYDFFSELVHDWEAAGELPSTSNCRRVIIRSGVVLGRRGGMIKQTFIPFFLGLGGPIGSGSQYMPWIHIDDLVELFLFSMHEEKVNGVLNGVSPEIITNKQFTTAFGKSLWRPAIIPIPTFVVNSIFNEERAKIVTGSQRVYPKRVIEYGFKYAYSDIKSACEQFSSFSYLDPY